MYITNEREGSEMNGCKKRVKDARVEDIHVAQLKWCGHTQKKGYPSKSLTEHHRGEEKEGDPEKPVERASLHKFENENWTKTYG